MTEKKDARGNVVITQAQRRHMKSLLTAPPKGRDVPYPTYKILVSRGWIEAVPPDMKDSRERLTAKLGYIRYRLTPVGQRMAEMIRDGER